MIKKVLVCTLACILSASTVIAKEHDFTPLATITQKVYFDIELEGFMLGRIIFGLYGDVVPKTVENFVALSKGDHGRGKSSNKPLSYVGTPFHRIIPGFMA